MFSQETLTKRPFRENNYILIGVFTKKTALALIVVLLILVLVVAEEEGKLYTYPLSVGEETYTVTVRSNYSSAPEVSYFGLLKYVTVNFGGCERATVFCNITVPADLIWGELSVYHQDYKQPDDNYTLYSNATHHSLQMSFTHIAAVEQISIKGTEGIEAELMTSSPSQ